MMLRAGPVTAQLLDGDLRYLSFGGKEVIRRIYFALRDRTWRTAPNRVENLKVEGENGGFHVTFDALTKLDEAEFRWSCIITGTSAGDIEYSLAGRALSTFERNRLGLCILHPTSVWAGENCRIETVDGDFVHGRFPREVSPHQPFFDIRAIEQQLTPDIAATLRFSGDVFEMEDQRNWTDASFKIYSTPLRLPMPVLVGEGTEIQQSVTLRLEQSATVGIQQLPEYCRMPLLGVQAGVTANDADYVSSAFDLTGGNVEGAWIRAVEQSGGKPIECAVTVGSEEQLSELRHAIGRTPAEVCRWLVSPHGFAESAASLLRTQAPVLAASFENFAQLNRNRPRMDNLDGIGFPVNPQTHAIDDLTIIENLGSQREVLSSASSFAASKLLAISPVMFKVAPDEALAKAWTLLSLKHLSLGGAGSITYAANTAIAAVLPELASFSGGEIVSSSSTNPLNADALILRQGSRLRVFLVNFAERDTVVIYNGQHHDLKPRSVKLLDFGIAP